MLNRAPLKDTTRRDEMKVFFLSELNLYVILESKFVIFFNWNVFHLLQLSYIQYMLAHFSVTAAAHEPNASSPTPVVIELPFKMLLSLREQFGVPAHTQ